MAFPKTTGDLVSAADWNSIGRFPIGTVTFGSDTFSHEFVVPSGFRSLELFARISHTGSGLQNARLFINQDTGSNYRAMSRHHIGDGTATTATFTGSGPLQCGSTASSAAQWVVNLANVSANLQTSFYGSGFIQTGPSAADHRILNMGGVHTPGEAVTHVRVTAPSATDLRAGTRLALYGIPA